MIDHQDLDGDFLAVAVAVVSEDAVAEDLVEVEEEEEDLAEVVGVGLVEIEAVSEAVEVVVLAAVVEADSTGSGKDSLHYHDHRKLNFTLAGCSAIDAPTRV